MEKVMTPESEKPKQRVVIPLGTIQEVDDLIADLHDMKRKAKQTATLRRVRRTTVDGRNEVVFEIYFDLYLCCGGRK